MDILLKRTILLISNYFPPETLGGATLARNRARIFHKLGYRVFVLAGFPSYPSGKVLDPRYKGKFTYIETLECFTIIRVRLLRIKHEGYLKRFILFLNFIFLSLFHMPKILKVTGKIDITYSLAPILFSSIIGSVYSYFTKSIFVYEAMDLWPEELIVFKTPLLPMIMSVGKLFAKLCYSFPDIIVTTTKPMAEYLSREYKPKSSVFGIPLGVEPSEFPKLSKYDSRKRMIQKKILPEQLHNKFIILYAGLISSVYKVENIVYAAEKLRGEREIVFVVIGEGDKKENIVQLKEQHSLDNLLLLPYQPRDLLPYIYCSADVCTIPLTSDPIFQMIIPTKFYEYLACFKPVIAICKGEVANLISSNNVGYAVDPDDINRLVTVIRELRDSPSLMQNMENNSRELLKSFTLDRLTQEFSNILK
jgi:glycosyltransferase involved in cell wall biosynthesis